MRHGFKILLALRARATEGDGHAGVATTLSDTIRRLHLIQREWATQKAVL